MAAGGRAVACTLGAVVVLATVLGAVGATVTAAMVHLVASLALVGLTGVLLAARTSAQTAVGTVVASALMVSLGIVPLVSGSGPLAQVQLTLAETLFASASGTLLVALGPVSRLILGRGSNRFDALLGTGTLSWLGIVSIPLASALISGNDWDVRSASPVLLAVPVLFGLHLGLVVRERTAARYRSQHDRLTGLANRDRFRELIGHDLDWCARVGRDLAVFSIGLHRFRVVNDNYGYEAGDELLRSVAARLVRELPVGGTVARIDGKVFAVSLALEPDGETASAIAHRLLTALTAPFWVHGRTVSVGSSIGIAVSPEDGLGREELLRAADLAQQQAERNGPSKVERYHESLHAGAKLQHALETSLQLAIERRQLTLAYQARIDRRAGEVVAVEALLRWHHPQLGAIPPNVFIPVAEECGLIDAVGRYALREATEQMATWRERGVLDVPVSVNVSAHQLRDPAGFAEVVAETLRATGLPADRLELELTESALLPDAPELASALATLRRRGVRLSIDDFGTGYSALAYLTTLSIDGLKIDRSFVSTIDADGGAAPVIDAIIALGTSLGLFVVAEGVESEAQACYLRSHGCHELQGYLHGRPLPPDVLEGAVSRSRADHLDVGMSLRDADERGRAEPVERRPDAPALHGALGWNADSPWTVHQDPGAVTEALEALLADDVRTRSTSVAGKVGSLGTATVVCGN